MPAKKIEVPSKHKSFMDTKDVEPVDPIAMIRESMTKRSKDGRESYTPVLILVHGNSCGHCVAFDDDWQEISKHMVSSCDVNTLKFEASNLSDHGSEQNARAMADPAHALYDHLSREVQSVPYIAIWTPDGSTEKFMNERTQENVVEFVRSSLKQAVDNKRNARTKPQKAARKSK